MQPAEQPAQAGTLYVVATPLGNLRDITLHALDVLKSVDLIAAEDTRVTQKLLSAYGLQARLTPLHEHNERLAGPKLVAQLRGGASMALVSDAGTPAISDPGALLVQAARAAGITVVAVPGPSAVATALSAAGLDAPHWLFYGFLPAKAKARRQALEELRTVSWPMLFYEAPHRIADTLEDLALAFGPDRVVTIARELTKRFEQVHTLPLAAAAAWLAEDEHRSRGEFVLIVAGRQRPTVADEAEGRRVLGILLADLPASQAARLAARITGCDRATLYAWGVPQDG